jgi:branched-chain amino acid transport system ATP-binding protein
VQLRCQGIVRRFGGLTALDGVDLDVAPSSAVGIIGHNGAGKTTLFDVISGFLAPEAGSVRLGDTDVTGEPPHRRAIAGLGRSFQEARLFPSLTVAETVAVALERHLPNHDTLAAALALPASTYMEAAVTDRVDELLALLGLTGYRHHRIADLSTGTRRIVELACVLAQDPAVLLLDEPSAGVAQRETEALGPLLRRVRAATGCSLVIIEHDMGLLSAVCDELVALEFGSVIARGTPAEVLAHPRVISSYLGADQEAIRRSGHAPLAAVAADSPHG